MNKYGVKKIIDLFVIKMLIIILIIPIASSNETKTLASSLLSPIMPTINGTLDRYTKDNHNYTIYSTFSDVDGFNLNILRYKPEKNHETIICKYPVILLHGLFSNKHSLDFGEKGSSDWENYSLAAFLSNSKGERSVSFDIWVPELRGKRSLNKYIPGKVNEDNTNYDWCFDDYVDKDLPSIINYIQKIYAEEENLKDNHIRQVFLVGMSMGGMIGYAYGETEEGFQNLKGIVTIGSPVAFEYNQKWYTTLLKLLVPKKIGVKINLKEILDNLPGVIEIMENIGANPENIKEGLFEKFVKLGFDNYLSSKILSHFSIFFIYKDFCRYPKYPVISQFLNNKPFIKNYIAPESYKKNLYKFKSPLLAISGGMDKHAPPEEVKYAVDHIGSSDVTYMEFSKNSEFTDVDYGHLDFHLGKNVKDEFYPQIYNWLTSRM